jgi:hypothetical protein
MALLCGVLCVMKTDFLRSISPVTGCQKLGKVMDEMMRESSYVRVVRFVLAIVRVAMAYKLHVYGSTA